jgi:hypothetical protein
MYVITCGSVLHEFAIGRQFFNSDSEAAFTQVEYIYRVTCYLQMQSFFWWFHEKSFHNVNQHTRGSTTKSAVPILNFELFYIHSAACTCLYRDSGLWILDRS